MHHARIPDNLTFPLMQKVRHIFFALLLWAVWATTPAQAQCDRVGRVKAVDLGCGALIADLDSGLPYRAVEGGESLTAGQLISFSSVPATLPPVCPQGSFNTVALTCLSDTLPCSVSFSVEPSPQQPLRYRFRAKIYDEQIQHIKWDFGDGIPTTGLEVEHDFPTPGLYDVCATLSDVFGCQAQYCAPVAVNLTDYNACGFSIELTSMGDKINGSIIPLGNATGLSLDSIRWYTFKNDLTLSESPSFTATMAEYGHYNVCAQYIVRNANDGSTCRALRCANVTVIAPSLCENPVLVNKSALCPSEALLNAPVCGCNNITYPNECQAIAAGVSQWWSGACKLSSCIANFKAVTVNGSPDDGYTVRLQNQSLGSYIFAQIDYGDGSPIWEGGIWDEQLHHFPAGGIYKVNLTVWNLNGCVSSVTELLATDAHSLQTSPLPEGTDYVFPGDANRDLRANVHDLPLLGVAHFNMGAPRPEAHTNWAPQFAPNWEESLPSGINFKHLDCDGNGWVNELDADVIGKNYTAIDTTLTPTLSDAPSLRLLFEQDTIYVNPNTSDLVEIKATLRVGSPSKPALGLYGLSFTLLYPEYTNHNPDATYNADFFGNTNHLLWLDQDVNSRHQLDIGLTRKNGQPVNGYGRIANLTFTADVIIIIDVISRSEKNDLPFAVPIRGLRAIDKYGHPFILGLPDVQDTVWIKLLKTTSQTDVLRAKLRVSPNPSSEMAELYSTADLKVLSIEAVNSLGQRVRSFEPSGTERTRLYIGGCPPGLYTLRIRTDQGIAEKKLLVK